jgi:hypothetical protein
MTTSKKILALCCLAFLASASAARADEIFTSTSSDGYCCFSVDLHSVSADVMKVTVSLTSGAEYFVNTGGSHPGFAFSLAGDPTITISDISSPWTSSDFSLTSYTTGGPSLGKFDYSVTNPGNGASDHNSGPLVFEITDLSGISYSSFTSSTGSGGGNLFVADIQNCDGNTGLGYIPSTPGVAPEPSSLILLGTGVVGLAGVLRRRMSASKLA